MCTTESNSRAICVWYCIFIGYEIEDRHVRPLDRRATLQGLHHVSHADTLVHA